MKVGTKVTYTKKGYARDFIYTMTSLTAINNLKKEEYTQRRGTVTNIEKAKCGLVTYTVTWEDVGGYFQDDTSYVQDEDIQEIEEEAPTKNQPIEETMKQETKGDYIMTKNNNFDWEVGHIGMQEFTNGSLEFQKCFGIVIKIEGDWLTLRPLNPQPSSQTFVLSVAHAKKSSLKEAFAYITATCMETWKQNQ